jgi:hypothetical protein
MYQRAACPPVRESLLVSGPDYIPVYTYYSRSSASELLEDPGLRLALLLIYQQVLIVYRILLAILPYTRTSQLVFARIPITVTTGLGITIAQSTLIVITTRYLTPPQYKSPGINGSIFLGPGTHYINIITACPCSS